MKIFAVTLVFLYYTLVGATEDQGLKLNISQASNQFASQLYQEVAKTPGNVLVCPASLHIALALVHHGAGGTTKSQLANTLHLSDSNDNIKTNYKTLLTGLEGNELKIATKLYPAVSFQPKPEYVSVAQEYFMSDVQALDYSKADESAKIINTFVENKTNDRIHDIIKSDSLTDLTRLVIVNAVHFKANWANTFPPPITDNFKVTPSQTVKTEFLSQTDFFSYKEDKALEAKVLKMDYEGGNFSMVFVLPNKEDGLPELEAKLATISMDTLLSGLRVERVNVTIPKFKIEQQMELKDVLVKMGIEHLFDTRADLNNLANEKDLYVSSVIQKTFIDVNEKGTEAAAATVLHIVSYSAIQYPAPPEVFQADHPFVFYLIQARPTLTLFSGRFTSP